MYLIVNLNLAIDKTIEAPHLVPGGVHRSTSTSTRAGGKGVNVARALKALGEQSLLIGFTGGPTGELIRDGLSRASLNFLDVRVNGDSRTCFIIREADSHSETVINEPGVVIEHDDFTRLETIFLQYLGAADTVILTGSLPPGTPTNAYRRLIDAANRQGRISFLDASGEALEYGLLGRPSFVKINQIEAAGSTSFNITDSETAIVACRRLQQAGARHAMITLGPNGAAAIIEGQSLYASSPQVTRPKTVGCGDAVLAGLAYATIGGLNPIETTRLAIAAGAAAAEHGIENLSMDDIKLMTQRPQIVARGSVID